MTGLIAVHILADESGDICLIPAGCLGFCREQIIQLPDKRLPAAHEFDEPADVLRRREAVLPGIGFRVVEIYLKRIERGVPAAVVAGAEEFGTRVEQVFVLLGFAHVEIIKRR